MTQDKQTHQQTDRIDSTTRRGALAGLGGLGLLAALGGSAQADVGGGPESDELSHLLSRFYEGPEDELPDPGVEGRRFLVTDDGGEYEQWTVLRDDGSQWAKIDLGVGSLGAERLHNMDNAATVRVGKDDGTVYASTRDGVIESDTDATVVLQAALDYIGNLDDPHGGKLSILRGVYEVDTTLEVPNHCRIEGEVFGNTNGASVVKLADGANTDMWRIDNPIDKGEFVEFVNITWYGNKENNDSGHGIVYTQESHGDLTFFSIYSNRFPDDGFHLETTWGTTLLNVFSEHHGGHGVRMAGGSQPKIGFSKIGLVDGDGINSSARQTQLIGNEILTCDGEGINMRGSANESHVIGNNIRNSLGGNFGTQLRISANEVAVSGNHIDADDKTASCVRISGDSIKLSSNVLTNYNDLAVRVEEGSENLGVDGYDYVVHKDDNLNDVFNRGVHGGETIYFEQGTYSLEDEPGRKPPAGVTLLTHNAKMESADGRYVILDSGGEDIPGVSIYGGEWEEDGDREVIRTKSDNWTIKDIHITGAGRSGIRLDGDRCRVVGCLVENVPDHGLEVNGNENVAYANQLDGIADNGTDNDVTTGNVDIS